MTVAALYVQKGGAYFGLPGVDPWDEERDARLYEGPHPVVAHPPCSRWCQLAHVNQARYGHRVGDDGGCFKAALSAVRKWGGVLEHPAYTYAWAAHGLLRPSSGVWHRGLIDGAWVTEVSQSAYGHQARKRTWLYYIGGTEPFRMDWRDAPGTHWVGNDGTKDAKPMLSKKAAAKTPEPFRDALLALARSSKSDPLNTRASCAPWPDRPL